MIDFAEKKLLRIDEVARYLNVHSRTVRRWIEEGRLSAEKLGGSVRIPIESIANFRTRGQQELKKV